MIPSTPRTCSHLVNWCLGYQSSNIVPQPPHIRFAIGVYQMGQGINWTIAGPVKWQSYCAASMHFIMAASAYGILMCDDFPDTLPEITDEWLGWEHFVFAQARVQQQICYHESISAASARKSRFNRDVLRLRFYDLVCQCFALVPPDHREQCCYDEMFILTKDIVIKPTLHDHLIQMREDMK
jgi:hypothetical protein